MINCDKIDCKEEGKYWFPDDGIIRNLCKEHWEEARERALKE